MFSSSPKVKGWGKYTFQNILPLKVESLGFSLCGLLYIKLLDFLLVLIQVLYREGWHVRKWSL